MANEGFMDILSAPDPPEDEMEDFVGKEVEIRHEELGEFKTEVKGVVRNAIIVKIPKSLKGKKELRDYMADPQDLAKAGLSPNMRFLKLKAKDIKEGKETTIEDRDAHFISEEEETVEPFLKFEDYIREQKKSNE